MKKINIAVDGTAGSGKTSTFLNLSKRINYNFIDTGLMYRAFTRYCIQEKVDFKNLRKIIDALNSFKYNVKQDRVIVNGIDVTESLAEPDIIENISKITVIKEVRSQIIEISREMVEEPGNIMVGRDITSVVLPNADLKIYFDCSLEERASRRFEQNKRNNINISYEKTYNDLMQRDKIDRSRKDGPLIRTEDSLYIDSTNQSMDQIVEYLHKIILELTK